MFEQDHIPDMIVCNLNIAEPRELTNALLSWIVLPIMHYDASIAPTSPYGHLHYPLLSRTRPARIQLAKQLWRSWKPRCLKGTMLEDGQGILGYVNSI